jgi:hypothetical protein
MSKRRTRSQRPSKAPSRASEAPPQDVAAVANASSEAPPARVSMLPPESDELAALDAGWDDVHPDVT